MAHAAKRQTPHEVGNKEDKTRLSDQNGTTPIRKPDNAGLKTP
jgi:hypothetical protein